MGEGDAASHGVSVRCDGSSRRVATEIGESPVVVVEEIVVVDVDGLYIVHGSK